MPANLLESRALQLDDLKVTPEHKLLSFNAQSINNKFQSIRDLVHKCDPIALCIQETWGRNPMTDYSIKGYHKPDIQARKGTMNAGRGVGSWIREDLSLIHI